MADLGSDWKVCRFGLYEADLATGRLSRQGVQIKLQEQPFRILALLLERAGEMVTREELRSLLWSEGTYVEFDGSLNTALMKLRAALNDDADNPRFIETVPRKGYRFIAPVHVLENRHGQKVGAADAASGAATDVPSEGPPKPQERTPLVATASAKGRRRLVGTSALVAAGVAALLFWRYWPLQEPKVLRVTALTRSGRVAPDSKIVTDGTRVYFVAEQEGRRALLQTSVRGGTAEPVATPFENTEILDVSPDRAQFLIAPFPHGREAVPLWVWSTHEGAPQRLGDVTATDAAWSPDGTLIAFVQDSKLFTVKPDGTGVSNLAAFSAIPRALSWSPDGKTLRFTQTSADKATEQIWEISADGKGLRGLFGGIKETHEVAGVWAGGGSYFLFAAGSDTRVKLAVDTLSTLWAARERGALMRAGRGAPVELTQGPVSYTELARSPTGTRIFALGTHPEYQLIRIDPETQKSTRLLEDAGATTVDYSPDGRWIVYALRQNGSLWKSRRDGSGRLELTSTSPGAFAPSWSPDGKDILFTAFFLGKQPQLYVIPSEGGSPRSVLPAGMAGSTISGDWSPDSREIVMDYQEDKPGASTRLQILNVQNGNVTTLEGTSGLRQPRWAPDGKHLAAVDHSGHLILLSDERGRDWKFLAQARDPHEIYWSADGKSLYFQDRGDEQQSVFRVRLGDNKAEKILGFAGWMEAGAAQCHFTGVGPDGSIYATIDHGGTDLYALDLDLP